jgi:hypothetical protein
MYTITVKLSLGALLYEFSVSSTLCKAVTYSWPGTDSNFRFNYTVMPLLDIELQTTSLISMQTMFHSTYMKNKGTISFEKHGFFFQVSCGKNILFT